MEKTFETEVLTRLAVMGVLGVEVFHQENGYTLILHI